MRDQVAQVFLTHGWPPRPLALTSSVVGMASAQASREATIAPAALQNRIAYSRSQPASRPWHSAPPNASPAPRPLTTSTGIGGTETRSLPSQASTPFGPCLTMASSTPAACSASAAACGSRTPTAVSHSSRLPTATVT